MIIKEIEIKEGHLKKLGEIKNNCEKLIEIAQSFQVDLIDNPDPRLERMLERLINDFLNNEVSIIQFYHEYENKINELRC